MSEQKKVDIFSLYEREKKITLSDGEKSVDVLFVKMTQSELQEGTRIYNQKLNEERESLKNNQHEIDEIKNLISMLPKKELVESILMIEKVYREQIADLYPTEEDEKKTGKEKQEARDAVILLWESVRKQELELIEIEKLQERLFVLRSESLASIRAVTYLNNYSLSIMVRDPETREKIFKTPEDVLRVKERGIIDKLLEVLNDFRMNITDSKIREISDSENFMQAGQSQEK